MSLREILRSVKSFGLGAETGKKKAHETQSYKKQNEGKDVYFVEVFIFIKHLKAKRFIQISVLMSRGGRSTHILYSNRNTDTKTKRYKFNFFFKRDSGKSRGTDLKM